MEQQHKQLYESPTTEVVELRLETGLLAGSPGGGGMPGGTPMEPFSVPWESF